MTSNDQLLLSDLLAQRRGEVAPHSSADEFFELFTAEQILKDYDLSWDEVEAGTIGGGGDGGIDSVFLFVNGILIQEDTDISFFKGDVGVDLHIIQAKRSSGFSEDTIQKFRASSEDLLDLTKDLKTLETVYNAKLIEAFDIFRRAHRALASRLPDLRLHFHYATLGTEVHRNVRRQVKQLEETVKKQFSNAVCSFAFSGARELLEMARRRPRTTFDLPLADSPISDDRSCVCIVRLGDYAAFITDDSGGILKSLFEANVRDYQGDVQVNRGIRNTLESPKGEDFWWLNNGVTVVASKAVLSGKTLTIENPQIVNGHQTSVEIFEHFRSQPDKDERSVLVRVIQPKSEESHQRIIRATNSQTTIPIAFLKATDEIHHNIEDYFKSRGFYYDRRKNFYKNEGKPREKIVGVPYLAQAVMSVLLGRPNDARARPSTLLKREDDYGTVFDPDYPLLAYLRSVQIMKAVERFLREHSDALSAKEVNNLKFYLGYSVTRTVLSKTRPSAGDLEALNMSQVDDARLQRAYEEITEVYKSLGADDQIAKGKEFISALDSRLVNRYPPAVGKAT